MRYTNRRTFYVYYKDMSQELASPAMGHVPPLDLQQFFQCTATCTKSDSDYTSNVASCDQKPSNVCMFPSWHLILVTPLVSRSRRNAACSSMGDCSKHPARRPRKHVPRTAFLFDRQRQIWWMTTVSSNHLMFFYSGLLNLNVVLTKL